MKIAYRIIAAAGLLLTLIPPIVYLYGNISEDRMKTLMFIGAIIWFAGAIPWLGRKQPEG